MLSGAFRGFLSTGLLEFLQYLHVMCVCSGCCLYKLDLLDLDFTSHQLVHVHSRLSAPMTRLLRCC